MMAIIQWWDNLSTRMRDVLLTGILAAIAFFPRIFGLSVFLTADEPKSWFGRSIQFLQAIAQANWAGTWDSPAPGVTTMWAGSIGLILDYLRQNPGIPLVDYLNTVPFDPLAPAILPYIRLSGVLIAVLAVVFTYYWGQAIFGTSGAFFAALFIALNPFLMALSRILGHDASVTIFMWLSLLAFLRIKLNAPLKQTVPFVLVSGVFGGLAFLTKYPSLSLGAFIAVVLAIDAFRLKLSKTDALKRWIIIIGLWSVAAGVVFVMAFPAMWVDAIGRIQAIFADALRASGSPHPKGSFFMGQPVPDPGGVFYLLVTFFKTTPIVWLGWVLAVTGIFSPDFRRRWGRPALIFLAFALFYGLLVTIGGKKQDRYILPAFPSLLALAALGYAHLFSMRRWRTAVFQKGVLATGIVLIQLATVVPHFPYYFTYYNPLLGGGKTAERQIIVGWGEGLDAAARWLNTLPNAENLNVVAWYSTTFEPYFRGNAIYKIGEAKISRTPKPGLAADYVVFYINQVQRELPTAGALQFFRAVPPVHTVVLHGTPYAWIYPSVSMQNVIEDESRLVGQAALMGYNLIDPSGTRTTTLASDKTTQLQLFWEWQGKKANEPIQLEIVDDSGYVWGIGKALGTTARLPFEDWLDGMVARDDFSIKILPGTPPGSYRLCVWIDRPTTGEVVGVFPLDGNGHQVTITRPKIPPSTTELNLSPMVNAALQPEITLLGGNFRQEKTSLWLPSETRQLELFWRASAPIRQDYPVTIHLVDGDNTEWASWSGTPAKGRFPTGQWQQGDIVRDPWSLTLPPFVPPGDYRLDVTLGDSSPATITRLAVGGRVRIFEAPQMAVTVDAHFKQSIMLVGIQGVAAQSAIFAEKAHPLEITQVWQCTQPVETDFTITTQIINGENTVVAQYDAVPQDGNAPTSTWTPGEFVQNSVTLNFPADAGSPPYRLVIALYQPETGERLQLATGADHIEIPITAK